MITRDSGAPDHIVELHQAFFNDWLMACTMGITLYAGKCNCEPATITGMITVGSNPTQRCDFCGKMIRMMPVMMYMGGNKWKVTDVNSEGKFISRIVSLREVVQSPQSALGVIDQLGIDRVSMNG